MSIFTIRSGASSHPEETVLQTATDQFSTSGVLSVVANHFKVQAQAVPDMTLKALIGRAYIKGTSTPVYPVRSDADTNVTIVPNSSGNPRIDAIVLYIDLSAVANPDASNIATLVAVQGTPAASPVAPTISDIQTAIGASNPFIRLANVAVASGATSIVNGDITDTRTLAVFSFSGSGGSVSLVVNEVPSGAVDGSNSLFTTSIGYVAGSLQVFRDGQLMKGGGADYTETTPGSGTFTFVTAPLLGSVLLVSYKSAASSTGNADTVDGYDANATPTAGNLLPLNSVNQFPMSAMPPIRGGLLNGKIVPSVASNNLTVAIKGLDGNDPSASNPVYVRIGDTVRTITAPLSVTKNAGTNWFAAGSATLATFEIDYFVYLGYNAIDGVVIGFARIPAANIYSDFNVTTTNQDYCAISTITNAAATDVYEIVGRFAATLGVSATYLWTIPTFTAKNLIQRPIYHTRPLQFASVMTGVTSPISSSSRYWFYGNLFKCMFNVNGTSAGTTWTATVPYTSQNLSNFIASFVVDAGAFTTTPGRFDGINLYTNMSIGAWTNSATRSWLGWLEGYIL